MTCLQVSEGELAADGALAASVLRLEQTVPAVMTVSYMRPMAMGLSRTHPAFAPLIILVNPHPLALLVALLPVEGSRGISNKH